MRVTVARWDSTDPMSTAADTAHVTAPRLHAVLAPEHRLLFGSAVPAFAPSPQLIAAVTPAGWDALRYTAEREKAVIALTRLFATLGPAALPERVAPLRALAMVMEFRMHHLRQRLGQSVAALRAAGIPVLLLKGAAVATWYHGSFVARPMLDLDLLVPPDRAREAYDALLATGWAVPAPEDTVALPPGGIHHLPALHDASGVAVNLEVHTDVIPPGHPFAFGAGDVWNAARALSGSAHAGTHTDLEGALVPSPAHMALHACIHLAWQHMLRTGTWRTARDLRVITADPAFRWDDFVMLAHATRAASAAYWTLRLCEGLTALPVPPAVLAALAPAATAALRPVHRRLDDLVERHLLAVLIPGGIDCPSVRLRRLAWELALRPAASGHGNSRPWLVEDDADPVHSAPASGDASLQGTSAAAGRTSPSGPPRWREMARYARAVLRSSHPTAF